MAHRCHNIPRATHESMNEAYKLCKRRLENGPDDIYPLDDLEGSINRLYFASESENLYRAKEFKTFLKYVGSVIKYWELRLKLDEFDLDRKDRIEAYTTLYNRIYQNRVDGDQPRKSELAGPKCSICETKFSKRDSLSTEPFDQNTSDVTGQETKKKEKQNKKEKEEKDNKTRKRRHST